MGHGHGRDKIAVLVEEPPQVIDALKGEYLAKAPNQHFGHVSGTSISTRADRLVPFETNISSF